MSFRVLHVQDHTIPEMSGYAIRSRYLVETQRRLGVDAEVVSSARHRKFGAPVEELEGLRFHRTPWPASAMDRWQLKVPFWRERILTRAVTDRVLEVARDFRPALLHAHSPMFNGQAALAAGRSLGIPVVYEIRAFWEDDAVDKGKFSEGSFVYRQVRRLETSVCRRADHVVTICDGLKRDLIGRGIAADKISVVPNGVDADRFQPLSRDESLARDLGLSEKTVIGFVGSFFRYEGLPLLVEAMALLANELPDLRLLLVGGGEDEEATRKKATDLALGNRVLFAGRVPHAKVDSYYSVIDLLVYPRYSKRITELVTPLKPLEALAMAKPILGSDVGGYRELVADCAVGRQFKAGSASDLAASIRDFCRTSDSDRRSEGAKGPGAVRARRSWTDMAARVFPAYAGLAPEAWSTFFANRPTRAPSLASRG